MLFTSLRVNNWRQFSTIDLKFHNQLTVLTGANGAGKTTLLNLLSRQFGWQATFVSTPRRTPGTTYGYTYYSDYWTQDWLEQYMKYLDLDAGKPDLSAEEMGPPAPPVVDEQKIGEIGYSGGTAAQITLPRNVAPQFNVNIRPQPSVRGIHIPSHRPIYSYQTLEAIPTTPQGRDQMHSRYMDIVRSRYYGGHHQRTPNYFLKETLAALATFGYGNAAVEPNSESLALFEGFQTILATILPPSLGFTRISIRLPEVVLVTRSGDFSLDAVSGGLSSLIDLAWQIFVYSPAEQEFVVTIDEPENHLHPELQRTVLPNLVKAFPKVQFICASHNPFIVTSVPNANVYVLRYGAERRVYSDFLELMDRSGSSNEILRDVLGVSSSSPLWVQQELAKIEASLEQEELTEESIVRLQERLAQAGLQRFLPTSLAKLARDKLKK